MRTYVLYLPGSKKTVKVGDIIGVLVTNNEEEINVRVIKDILTNYFRRKMELHIEVDMADGFISEPGDPHNDIAFQIKGYKPEVLRLHEFQEFDQDFLQSY